MRRFLIALIFSVSALPLQANPFCDDLWFARNQLFDRAGYCFGSTLGQAVFDNRGCIGKEVTLEPGGREMVAAIKTSEARNGCNTNTSRTWLDVSNLDLRMRLDQVVYRSEFASGCLGWQGGPLTLFTGPYPGSAPISRVSPGDDIIWEYDSLPWPDGWWFISVHRDGVEIGLGWRPADFDDSLCTQFAG